MTRRHVPHRRAEIHVAHLEHVSQMPGTWPRVRLRFRELAGLEVLRNRPAFVLLTHAELAEVLARVPSPEDDEDRAALARVLRYLKGRGSEEGNDSGQ
jgi:hypothetical protein